MLGCGIRRGNTPPRVPCMHCARTMHALCTHRACTMHALCMHRACTMHVPWHAPCTTQVSGTPLGHGRLADVYGLMSFLRLEPWADKAWWGSAPSNHAHSTTRTPCAQHSHTMACVCACRASTMHLPCHQVAARHQRAAHRHRAAPRRQLRTHQLEHRHAPRHAGAACWYCGKAWWYCGIASSRLGPCCPLER